MNRRASSKAPFVAAGLLPAFWCFAAGGVQELPGQTSVRVDARTLPIAPLGPATLWPRFRFQIRDAPVHASAGLSEEDRAGMFTDAAVAPLPYLVQENYTRQRRRGTLPIVVVENAALRATLYPTLGGRMISLYDKHARRELLFDNPVFQPANLAIRNAWFSGGVEWNGPLYGHSLLTCSPVFAGLVQTPRGPVLRLYEFDRALETTWQVDLFLPPGDDRLWVHVKAINPNTHAVRFYWWTNIAVPLVSGTRVLVPADYALSHDSAGIARQAFPVFEGFDGSYPLRYPHARSVFFRKPGSEKPWSACVDGEGRGLCHVSTPTLSGRKLFTWGTGRGGKRWMDFLSQDGRGDYIEIQGGVTPTQLQTLPLEADASIQWTECLSPLAMEAKAAHDADYFAACSAAAAAIDQRVPSDVLRETDQFLSAHADTPIQTVFHRGSAWGQLYEKRTGRTISPGLAFESTPGDEERPWAELLDTGTFSAETLNSPPRSFNVAPGWVGALRASASTHGATWLHCLHLGVAELEAGRFPEAQEQFERSLATKPNAPAFRNLALLHERGGQIDAAESAYQQAWPLAEGDQNLAIEICDFFKEHNRYDAFFAFVESLPAAAAGHERIALMQAEIALEQGDYPAVRRLLEREFATIREGEVSLSDLWFASYIKEAESRLGHALTPAEKQQLIGQYPPPRSIDFRMK